MILLLRCWAIAVATSPLHFGQNTTRRQSSRLMKLQLSKIIDRSSVVFLVVPIDVSLFRRYDLSTVLCNKGGAFTLIKTFRSSTDPSAPLKTVGQKNWSTWRVDVLFSVATIKRSTSYYLVWFISGYVLSAEGQGLHCAPVAKRV